MRQHTFAACLAAGLGLMTALPASAGALDDAQLEKLLARLDRLETRNAELEREVQALKGENQRVTAGLESPRLSETEPELTVRLKAVEQDTLDMKKAVRLAEGLEGIKVEANLATVAQKVWGLPAGISNGRSQLNYRADVAVELPLAPLGDVDHKLYAHVRMGQGLGLNETYSNLAYFSSAPNALAFRASGSNPDDSVAILGQAWYQAVIPLPWQGFKPHSRESLAFTFGKMDIFSFFDQNHATSDESHQFINSALVHNPLLDAAGETGVDANGFQPGFIAAYRNESNKVEPWQLSVGVFGAGERGANYQRSLASPLVMVQAEKTLRLFEGLPGNYRIYAWQRSEAGDFDGTSSQHRGIGLSIDQRVGDGLTLFGRYGKLQKGELPFNSALTLGTEISGIYWDRGADALGLAVGWLRSGQGYRAGPNGSQCPAGHDDSGLCRGPVLSFTPQGTEKLAEIYYRYQVTPQFQISPDLQFLRNGGGLHGTGNSRVLAIRANLAY